MSTTYAASMTGSEFMHLLWQVLGFELFELEGHPIVVGKLLSGICLLILSFAGSKRLARWIDRRVLGRLPIDESMHHTFVKLVYYVLLFLSLLFTLRLLHVPLTVFTVIGGALAVGIGFGSQNLVNNFISGVLVMLERPVRIGDYIEVNALTGQVQNIGIRSTTIRTPGNTLIVIPNTNLIDKHLINWTQSGLFWTSVRVGVVASSDPARVRAVGLECLRDLDGVLGDPAPGVAFADFGENVLYFDLSFAMPALFFPSRGRIQSEVRYRIYEFFARASITLHGAVPPVT